MGVASRPQFPGIPPIIHYKEYHMLNFTKTIRNLMNNTNKVLDSGANTAVESFEAGEAVALTAKRAAKGVAATLTDAEKIGEAISAEWYASVVERTTYAKNARTAKSGVVSHYNKLREAKRQAHRFFITNQDKTQEVLTQSQIATILPLLTTFELNREELQELLKPATVGQLFNVINNIAITTRSLLSLFKDMDTVYEEMDQDMLHYPQDIIDELYAAIAQITTLPSDVELDDTK